MNWAGRQKSIIKYTLNRKASLLQERERKFYNTIRETVLKDTTFVLKFHILGSTKRAFIDKLFYTRM